MDEGVGAGVAVGDGRIDDVTHPMTGGQSVGDGVAEGGIVAVAVGEGVTVGSQLAKTVSTTLVLPEV